MINNLGMMEVVAYHRHYLKDSINELRDKVRKQMGDEGGQIKGIFDRYMLLSELIDLINNETYKLYADLKTIPIKELEFEQTNYINAYEDNKLYTGHGIDSNQFRSVVAELLEDYEKKIWQNIKDVNTQRQVLIWPQVKTDLKTQLKLG